MICKSVSIEQFRNIENAAVDFAPGVNVIWGDNAQGKTNLLESVYMAALTRSFRTPHEADVIGFDRDFARIHLEFEDSLRTQTVDITLEKNKKRRIEHNRVKITKMSEAVGVFRVVLFCPEHLSLIKDGPGMRRNYMDIAISQQKPLYLHALQKYNKILKERNSLIHLAEEDPETFRQTAGVWSEELARQGAIITRHRVEFLERVRDYTALFFKEMTDEKETPKLCFISSSKLSEQDCHDEKKVYEAYRELLTTRTEREIAAGTTLYGIHRDDLDVDLNGKSARLFASQGQQRSLALAMKLAEGEICRDLCGEYPVFLFDDVLSELDANRRRYLVEKIAGRQVIMTCCDDPHYFDKEKENVKVIRVKNGSFAVR